ncbi:MAG: RraA family protein [Betaproteobacteria bacterium]
MSQNPRIAAEVAARLGKFPAATLYEAAGKAGGMGAQIRAMVPGAKMAGIACTIRILGAETLAVLRALEAAPQGSVLVIDCGSVGTCSVWGGTSSLASKVRSLAGCVTNGNVRDTDEIRSIGVPVYGGGVSVTGTLKNHPGWTGVEVSVGGVTVRPGDYVIGDADGVVVIPQNQSEIVLAAAAVQKKKEDERDARIRAGEPLSVVLGLPKER